MWSPVHSPDSDDAFMFAGLSSGAVSSGGLEVTHELCDIETLNQRAVEGRYEITAISFHAYPHIADRYDVMDVGASFGDGYGPIIVSREKLQLSELKGKKVGLPGIWTTATLATRLACADIVEEFLPFDTIPDAVASGRVDAGVLIHEGQLTYPEQGLPHELVERATGKPLSADDFLAYVTRKSEEVYGVTVA